MKKVVIISPPHKRLNCLNNVLIAAGYKPIFSNEIGAIKIILDEKPIIILFYATFFLEQKMPFYTEKELLKNLQGLVRPNQKLFILGPEKDENIFNDLQTITIPLTAWEIYKAITA
jgi:hypothetical protein